tara:strand:+ start:1800 stop:2321 length:522 start_codon:yes stop_codon:yes gene_type:complete
METTINKEINMEYQVKFVKQGNQGFVFEFTNKATGESFEVAHTSLSWLSEDKTKFADFIQANPDVIFDIVPAGDKYDDGVDHCRRLINGARLELKIRAYDLEPCERVRAKEIIKADREEMLIELKWKYQRRSHYAMDNPVSTTELKKWVMDWTHSMNNDHSLKLALQEAGELF